LQALVFKVESEALAQLVNRYFSIHYFQSLIVLFGVLIDTGVIVTAPARSAAGASPPPARAA
jgi:hypothetical protein